VLRCQARPVDANGVGCGRVGTAAKNVMLAGVKAVTLHDEKATVLQDLGGQFYLAEADVGANRATACAARVQELNSAVAVDVSTEPITEEFLGKFSVRARAAHVSSYGYGQCDVPSHLQAIALAWRGRQMWRSPTCPAPSVSCPSPLAGTPCLGVLCAAPAGSSGRELRALNSRRP
jgi:hypothetical protein